MNDFSFELSKESQTAAILEYSKYVHEVAKIIGADKSIPDEKKPLVHQATLLFCSFFNDYETCDRDIEAYKKFRAFQDMLLSVIASTYFNLDKQQQAAREVPEPSVN